LRNNSGGSLQEAVELTGLFIKDGPVVQVKQTNGSIEDYADQDTAVYYNGPLLVLVSRFSASASEIFAAAIQDYKRGIIVGENTFGKGTVQTLINLNEFLNKNENYGQLKLTIAKFYRISGGSTQHKGVVPDIAYPSPYAPEDFGESANKFALPYDSITPSVYNKYKFSVNIEDLIKKHNEIISQNSYFVKYFKEIE
jgi:carboxyl-terminal processing protease